MSRIYEDKDGCQQIVLAIGLAADMMSDLAAADRQNVRIEMQAAAEKIAEAIDRNTAARLDAIAWNKQVAEFTDIMRGYEMFLRVLQKKPLEWVQACDKCGYESTEPFRDCPECDEARRKFEDRKEEP